MNVFEKLRGASPLVVYVDLKSPYAFIAIEPTRAVARAAGVPVEWRPFTLDIPSYLGSARLDGAGRVVENRRSASQWSGVKYAYRDARRYARLGGKVLRGTEKIWDSSLAGIGLLWAQQQSAAIVDRYLDDSYRKFWQRALDIEDPQVVTAQLEVAGADVEGFAEFATGAGRALHDRMNAEAFAAGIFGVPSYLVADEFWFGREHLPRVAWLLQGRVGPAPLPAYPLPADPRMVDAGIVRPVPGPGGRRALRVAVDIRDPRVRLAWAPTVALARALAIDVQWLPFEVQPPAPPPPPRAEENRGVTHRRYRAEQQAREIACYAQAAGLALDGSLSLPLMAMLVLGKLAATTLTLGTGSSGGIFAPMLFVGAMLGGAFGELLHLLLPGISLAPSGAYALVGMAAVFSAAAHAPMTALLIVFEMSGSYSLILPLMLATGLSTVMARALRRESVYTLELVRNGIHVRRGEEMDVLQHVTVGEVMTAEPVSVGLQMPLDELEQLIDRTRERG